MRAVVVQQVGGPEVLEIRNIAEPVPGPGQVAIDVAYAGVNYAEVMARRGDFQGGSTQPFTPGLEVSGYIWAIGHGVEGFRVGQAVAAFTGSGGYAEIALASATMTIPLDTPAGAVDFRVAAAFPTIVPTAYIMLKEVARLRSGESMLVQAAAGAVGTTLGQLARHFGAELIIGTVGRAAKIDYALQFGYDHVVVRDDFVPIVRELTADRGVDVALDSVGGEVFTQSLDVLAPLGRLVIFGNSTAQPEPSLSAHQLWFSNKAVLGFAIGPLSGVAPQRLAGLTQDALHLVASGAVTIAITDTLPLDQVVEVHRRLESGASMGKIVLKVA